jgi:hypothetical protein
MDTGDYKQEADLLLFLRILFKIVTQIMGMTLVHYYCMYLFLEGGGSQFSHL